MPSTVVVFNTSGPLARQPFAVGCSADLENGPAAVRLLGRDLVLWRSPSGTVVAAPDLCTHSRGILSEGQVKDGCLICPNHGWTFGDAGRCVAKPTNLPIPDKAHLKTFPCVERYGLIWVTLGDPAAEVIDVVWDGDDGYRRVHAGIAVWRTNPIQILEGLLTEKDSPRADVVVDVPFVVRDTLRSESGVQLHRLLSCAPVDVRTSLVTSVIWTTVDGVPDGGTLPTGIATADLACLKSAAEGKGLQLPTIETSPDDTDTVLTDWKRRLLDLVG